MSAQEVVYDIEANDAKEELNITMRDGINLHTTFILLKVRVEGTLFY
jgi:predicted acyl esterase